MALLRRNWFNLALLLLLATAYLTRHLGLELGPVRPSDLSIALVAGIFLITGLLSPLSAFRAGVANIRLHVFAQVFAFVFVPAVTWVLLLFVGDFLVPEMRQGILLLAILPTTITSCTIYTTMAGGNVTGAAFNAFLGNFIGVMLTPLLFVFLVAPGAGLEIAWQRLGSLILLIIVPFTVGLLIRKKLGDIPTGVAEKLPLASALALLTIIFLAFQGMFAPGSPLWEWSALQLALPMAFLLGLHLFLLLAAWMLSAWSGLHGPDRTAALFVGTQKTIALGLPLIHFFMATEPHLAGALAIPLIIYHPMQMLIAAFVAQRIVRRTERLREMG